MSLLGVVRDLPGQDTDADDATVQCCGSEPYLSTVPRVDSANSNDLQITEFPRFPLNKSNEEFEIPVGISGDERSLLEKLQADDDKVNEIERKTRDQSNCQEWKDERKFRFTASNFGLICGRKRNHETLVKNLLNPKHFTSRYTNHGLKYEPIALERHVLKPGTPEHRNTGIPRNTGTPEQSKKPGTPILMVLFCCPITDHVKNKLSMYLFTT